MQVEPENFYGSKNNLYGFIPSIVALVFAFAVYLVSGNSSKGAVYLSSFVGVLAVVLSGLGLLSVSNNFKARFNKNVPFLSFIISILFLYEVASGFLGLLNTSYFPSLSSIAGVIVSDIEIISLSLFHSLILLISGYLLGAFAGFITGLVASTNRYFHYWLLPVVRVIGPIPATAWIPLCIILFPNFFSAGVFIIAVSVWFPVSVMTSSGIMNVSPTFFDAGKVLGASGFRSAVFIAVPAALPAIFTGLFMGMGSSFLTLIAAEMTGVKAGLGFYIVWARDYADYARIFASLIISSIMFFSIMTMLFKIRDSVLSWQKGLIKW
jgi:NitT/TauT family transport system permease protein